MVRDEQNLMFGLDEFKFDGKKIGASLKKTLSTGAARKAK